MLFEYISRLPALQQAFLFYESITRLPYGGLTIKYLQKIYYQVLTPAGFPQPPYRKFTFWQQVLSLISSFLLFDFLQPG
jgi:hypothetical protein